MREKIFALIAGSAIAVTAAVPASAAPVAWENDTTSDFENSYHLGCTWDDLNSDGHVDNWDAIEANPEDEFTAGDCIRTYVQDNSLDIGHFERYIGGDGSVTDSDGNPIGTYLDAPFCSSGWGIGLDPITESTVEIDSHGDQIYVIKGTYNGLDVVGELRMYSEQDLIRWHWTFTNNSGSDINGTNVEIDNGDTQDNYGDGTTSDGDQVWETGDWYATMFDADNTVADGDRTAIATAYMGGNGEIAISGIDSTAVITNGDELYLDYDFDVAAGETKELIYFLTASDYAAGEAAIDADTADPTVVDFGDGVVQGRYARGLVDNNNSNWETIITEVEPEEELPNTGFDSSVIAIAGIAAVAAGGAVIARRRRARA